MKMDDPLAWFATHGEQSGPDPDWLERWPGRSGTHYLQGRKKVRRVRRAVTATLRRFARGLGITGGIIAHQVSPCRTQDYRRGVALGLASFRHDYALLGEATFGDDGEADRFREETACRTFPYGAVTIRHPDLYECFNSPSVYWSCHPADDPEVDALRLFLAGSAANYPVEKLGWHVGGLGECRLTRNGVRGALALAPHFMMDEVQWWSYAEATRGLPLYVPFGTWHRALGEAKASRAECRRRAVLLPSPGRKAAHRRRQALKSANSQRRQESRQQLDRLLEVARPLYAQVVAEQSQGRGRPAHRARLRQLLEQHGHAVSEHRLKQVLRELRS
jgi:hypothetical protein